mgnify:CR=1 FL=1
MKESKLYRAVVTIIRPFVRILYRLKVVGLENIPAEDGVIICPNHTSNADPVVLAVSLKRQIYFMAKAELFKNKLLGKLFKMVGAFPVERGKGDTSAIDSAEKILKNGEQLGLFIEGTRSKTDDFLRPKTGCAMIAYKTGATIIPVCITGANEHKLKILKKNVISIGEPIKVNQLNVKEGTGKEFRDTSRFIMESIKELRPNFNE